jgi:hypothetical protein
VWLAPLGTLGRGRTNHKDDEGDSEGVQPENWIRLHNAILLD